LNKIWAYKKDMEDKAIVKAKVEGLDKAPELMAPPYNGDLKKFATFKCAFYLCFTCDKPYFGGMKDCIRAQEERQEFKPEDLVCGTCAAEKLGVGSTKCKTHGTEFIEFKCKFCCSIAQWFCWGNTHFCEECHKKQCAGDYVSRKKKEELPKCPGIGKCPLGVEHPPNGDEFPMGCSICRNAIVNKK
jgi:E3 ubiquitin-protein ligase MYCBP2